MHLKHSVHFIFTAIVVSLLASSCTNTTTRSAEASKPSQRSPEASKTYPENSEEKTGGQVSAGPKVYLRVPDLYQVIDVAVGPMGLVLALTSSRKICVFDGTAWKTFDRRNSGLIGGAGKIILADNAGNIWVGTDHELALYDGSRWLTYTQETAGLASNGVTAIAVIKDGPADPPVPKESRPGRLTGRIVSNGIPVSGAQVYICWDISWPLFSGSTPCLGKLYMVTTSIMGNFVLTGLPIGVYTIAVRRISAVQTKWYAGKSLGIPRNLKVLSGINRDLGDIELIN